ncbi:MAG: hypothetical protein K0R50_4606, partial [Eubacterium sp.]|nr:hypothetical protein [Eubacterium sp.]
VICQDSFLKDFDMFFLKNGARNRRSNFFVKIRMSVRLDMEFGV